MNLISTLLAPLALLLPGLAAVEPVAVESVPREPVVSVDGSWLAFIPPEPAVDMEAFGALAIGPVMAREDSWKQVRIEQRMTIRIAPRAPAPRPLMLQDLPDGEVGPRFEERKMGKCLPVSSIAGVQVGEGARLILFLRDHRIVSASLDRSCRARDFYSGFYLSKSDDGNLCVDRDVLLSRNGANCRVTRMRRLVEVRD